MKKVVFFRSIHFKFVLVYILLIIIAMQVIGVLFMEKQESHLLNNFKKSVKDNVNLIEVSVQKTFETQQQNNGEDPTNDPISAMLENYQFAEINRIIVVDRAQKVVASDDRKLVGSKVTQKLIKHVLKTGNQTSDIYLKEGKNKLIRTYVLVIPVKNGSETLGAIYIEAPVEDIFTLSRTLNGILANATFIALAITGLLGIILARTITRPLADMQKQAKVMARGDFTRTVKVYDRDEIGHLADSFNDLTHKLQEANAITESERTKLRSVLSYMTDGVIATDREGYVILMNDRAEEMLSMSRYETMGKYLIDILDITNNFSIHRLDDIPDSLLLDFSSNGNPLIARASFSVIQKDDGPINGIITVLHDVTEQQQIEKDRREFVSNVSHELRTPLTTMRSYLEALEDGAWKDEKLAPKFLNVTQRETERMIRLVSDLLQLSKMDNQDYQPSFKKVNITELIHQVIDRFEMSKNENISFEKHITEEQLPVQMDKDKITQVLDNVISNALKYSPDGGKITFYLFQEKNSVHLSVRDEGFGIPKKNLSKVFERFYRVDKARSREVGGTGLGLAIAKEVVTKHGGAIWAESEYGKGTIIHVTLPSHQIQRGSD